MPRVTLTRLTGYRRSRRGDNDAQLFAQSRTLRIRQATASTYPLLFRSRRSSTATILMTLTDFH